MSARWLSDAGCRSQRPVRPAGILLLTLVVTQAASAGQAVALPQLPIEAYPDRARDTIAPLYAVAKARPNDAAAAGALGRALQAWDQLEDAHSVYQKAQALAPADFDWAYLDAIVLSELARHEDAARQFRRSLSLSPGYLPARLKLAETLVRAGRAEEARPEFESLRASAMTRPFAEYGLGQLAAAAGQHERAIEHFERAVSLVPEWGEAHYALALSYTRLGRTEEAERAMAARLRHGSRGPGLEDPVMNTTATVRSDAVALLQRGVKLEQAGDLAAAIAAHEAAVRDEPSFAQAHLNLMLLYGRTQNWAKVDEHYQKAVALGFSLGDVNYNYGYAQQLQGRWDLAEAAYRRALDSNPHHFAARVNLGLALERRKALADAAAEFRRAAEIDPVSRPARFYLARVLLDLRRPAEAIVELEKITRPHDAEAALYLHALAIAYLETGNRAEATRHANTAREVAQAHQQTEIAAAVDRTLAVLKGSVP
jgi:tetratricopeptide (TPR) repeat protein